MLVSEFVSKSIDVTTVLLMAVLRTKVSGPSVVYEATKRSDKIGDGSVL